MAAGIIGGLLGAAGAAGGIAQGIGARKQRKAQQKAYSQQADFYREDARRVESLFEDRAERVREKGETKISQNEAMIGKYGGKEQLSGGTSLAATQEKSREDLNTDVENMIQQGKNEANRLRFQAKQAKAQSKAMKQQEPWMTGGSILGAITGGAQTGISAAAGL